MSNSIPSFLRLARDTVFRKPTGQSLTIVLGNTSADLDSFISAVVFAYFHTGKSGSYDSKLYIPLLNLPDVPSSELWRLRPEYGTALRLALHRPEVTHDDGVNNKVEKSLLKDLITIKDIREDSSSQLHTTFAVKTQSNSQATSKQDVVLVDHNAPQVPGLDSDELTARINVSGVVDHHVDENIVSTGASPRIVKTGIGSCTSLVVRHVQDEGLWNAPSQGQDNHVALAKLALAPILIDTANLTATGDKISSIDRDAVKFLESHITLSDPEWDRSSFYEAIQMSKSNKLKLLTMNEILESDYKEWAERPSNMSKPLNIGIASLVQDLPWLIEHAGSASRLTQSMQSFARQTDHELSILALITKGSGPNGEFRKEMAIVAYGEAAIKALGIFEAEAGELQLQEWKEDEEFSHALGSIAQSENVDKAYKVWWQGDVSKSRKQVAPLLRDAVKKA